MRKHSSPEKDRVVYPIEQGFIQNGKGFGTSYAYGKTAIGLKGLDKKPESGIIVMHRKKGTHRRVGDKGQKIIDKATYNKIVKPIIKQGADIRIANEKWIRHLDNENSYAVTVGDVIIYRSDATVLDVLEETYHFQQNKRRLNDKYGNAQRKILNEIDAKEYLLSVIDKYNIPIEETEVTRKSLAHYKKRMSEMKERGEWAD